ncbi:TPA: hypothetical protein N2D16_002951 [Clostridium botulinum]|nr:hypothetical protein [Clostridium botulinum]
MNIERWTSSKKRYKLKIGRKHEGDNIMESVLERTSNDMQSRLNDITSKLNLLEGENDMIKLNPNNPEHMDWWEDN